MRTREFVLLLISYAIYYVSVSILATFMFDAVPHYHLILFVSSTAFIIFSLVMASLFGINWDYIRIRSKVLQHTLISILLGCLIGIWFYSIREPTPHITLVWVLLLDPLFVACAEELTFRGLLLQAACKAKISTNKANIIQATLFSLAHMNFSPLLITSYFIFAYAMGRVSLKKGLLYSIIIHFIANGSIYILKWTM